MGPGIASSLPASTPLRDVPLITDPAAAVEALVEFFENRQMLMREDFLWLLRRSQKSKFKVSKTRRARQTQICSCPTGWLRLRSFASPEKRLPSTLKLATFSTNLALKPSEENVSL
jgi:hypothetical protein